MKARVYIPLCLFCAAVTADAGTAYYIDFEAGSDTNDGKTIEAPFKHSPGDKFATLAAATVTLRPSDHIILKGGVTYVGRVDVNSSGTKDTPITYESGHLQTPAWGTNRAILSGLGVQLDRNSGFNGVLSLRNSSYIRVQGLEVCAVGDTNWFPYTGGIGWRGSSGGDIVISDCRINGGKTSLWSGIAIEGTWSTNAPPPSGFSITNCEIYDCGAHGVILRAGVTHVEIANNIIHDCGPNPLPYQGDGIFCADGNEFRPSGITIRMNTLYDFPSKGWVILYGANNVLVERNVFKNVAKTNNFGFEICCGTNIVVRNNLFLGRQKLEGPLRFSAVGTIANVAVMNNTVIGNGMGFCLAIHQMWPPCMVSNLTFVNNAIDLTDGGIEYVHIGNIVVVTNLVCQNNVYAGGNTRPFRVDTNTYTLSAWQASAFDTKSLIAPLAVKDCRPVAGSPLIGRGMLCTGFDDDFDGLPRGTTGVWDVGALRYGPNPPLPPQGLHAIVDELQ